MATVPSIDDDRGISLFQVLVVEDFEPFRRFVCSTLRRRTELQVICEVADGLEAVRKAEELQPDLILLDVGLPTLNGIEAARRIRTLSPESKILFVTQESSADVVQEALRLGALGYVAKINAGIELLVAVEAVCLGRRFVSSGLAGHVPAELAEKQTPKRLHPDNVLVLEPEAGG
jgi:DNA-binding NarL/FixJ family response regulator